jgi:hypothetical protein
MEAGDHLLPGEQGHPGGVVEDGAGILRRSGTAGKGVTEAGDALLDEGKSGTLRKTRRRQGQYHQQHNKPNTHKSPFSMVDFTIKKEFNRLLLYNTANPSCKILQIISVIFLCRNNLPKQKKGALPDAFFIFLVAL